MQAAKRLRQDVAGLDRLLSTIQSTVIQSATANSHTIVTHSGTFHCDEALACALLKALPRFGDFQVCRTRDSSLISQGEVVVDVGATFDAINKRFDHHQRGFEETFDGNHKIKLSSAGLVYKYFGKEILSALFPKLQDDEKNLSVLYQKVYEDFIEHIDGIDNGIEAFEGGRRNYRITTSLSSRVARLISRKSEDDENERFKEAMELTATEFCDCVAYLLDEWLPAREIVEQAMKEASLVHESGEILKIEQSIPWKGHVIDLEKATKSNGKFKFCLFPDGTNWRVQAIPPEGDNFGMRVPLHKSWQGLRDQELSKVSGIPDCIFVHASGFIGGNKTFKGALQMALKSIAGS